jgi:hypothetical protein
MSAKEFPICWQFYFTQVGERGVTRKQIQDCLNCGAGDQRGCESCRRWEERDHLYRDKPNCLFCGELIELGRNGDFPIYKPAPQWKMQSVFVDALVGLEDGPIRLEADPSSAPLILRFADLPVSDDPETRTFPFLKASN